MKLEIECEEVIEKIVKSTGNSGRVYLPPSWIWRAVKIYLLEEAEIDYINFKFISKIHDRTFYDELEINNQDTNINYFKQDGMLAVDLISTINPSERVDEDYLVIQDINDEFKINLEQFIVDMVDQEFNKFGLKIIR